MYCVNGFAASLEGIWVKDRKISSGLGSIFIGVLGLGLSFTMGPLWMAWAYAALIVLGVIILTWVRK